MTNDTIPLEQRVIGQDVSQITSEMLRSLRALGFNYWAIDLRPSFGCTTTAQGTILKVYCALEDSWEDQDRKTTPFEGVPIDALSYMRIKNSDVETVSVFNTS